MLIGDEMKNIVVIASLMLYVLQHKEASLQCTYSRHMIIKCADGISLISFCVYVSPTHTKVLLI